jgi:predicted DNA-binding transcriptional regulator AlpA
MNTHLHLMDVRTLAVLLALPPQAWITPREAAAILGLTRHALAARRSRGDWPAAAKLGPRLIRYRLGDLLGHPKPFDNGACK